MKELLSMRIAIFLAVFVSGTCLAADLTTADGKTYQNVKITRVDPDGLYIIHSTGGGKVRFAELPEEVRKQYGYDPAKEKAWVEASRAALVRQLPTPPANDQPSHLANAQELLQQGRACLAQGKHAEALQSFERAVQLSTDENVTSNARSLVAQVCNAWLPLLQANRQPLAKEIERLQSLISQTQEETKNLEQLLRSSGGARIGTSAMEARINQEMKVRSLQVETNNRMKVLQPLQLRLTALDAQIADVQSHLPKASTASASAAPAESATSAASAGQAGTERPWYEKNWKWLLGGLAALYLLSRCIRTTA